MDSVTASSRREALREKVDEAQAALRQTAMAARFKDDPLSEHLNALALCVGALGDIYQASEDTQLDIAETLKSQTDVITKEAIVKVHSSGMSLVQQLGPQLASAAEWSMRQRYKVLRLRTILGISSGLIAIASIPCAFTYAAGLNVGRAEGEIAAHSIEVAMSEGPGEATTWAMLMRYNDAVGSMKGCHKSISTDAAGRRYCQMPVWIDPPQMPNLH